jgi:D-aminopeptidase
VTVKRALSNVAGDCLAPPRARELIREAAARAVERAAAGALRPYVGESPPYEIEVELRKDVPDALRANLERLPEFEIAGPRTIRTLAPDMDLGFRRIAYLSFGDRPGATRY